MFGPLVACWFYLGYGVGAASIGELYAAVSACTLLANLAADPRAQGFGLVRVTTNFRVLQGLLLVPMVLAPASLSRVASTPLG